jgi:uncharacterized membrane protein
MATPRLSRLPYPLRIVRSRSPLLISIALAVIVAVALPSSMSTARRLLIGWDAGAAIYLAWMVWLIARSKAAEIRRHAADLDEGRFLFLALITAASLASLAAIVIELSSSQAASRSGAQIALATITITLSWFFIHGIFALHYAHEFYGDHGKKKTGGLIFPGEVTEPDYWDFIYFSFVIGMTFQVSDVAIASKRIRHTALAHGVVAFFFNVALLALVINIAAGAI